MKITVLTWLTAATILCAQDAPVAAPDASRQSEETLNIHLAIRERRLAELTTEIMERSQRTDARIGDLVTMLVGIRDSQASRRIISQVTGEAIGNLRSMIEIYQRERRTIAERLRTDRSAPADALNRDIDIIDALIERRKNDIIALARSIPGNENLPRLESADWGYSSFHGGFYDNSRVSDAWRQNRRDRVQSTVQLREVQRALEDSLTDLRQRQRRLTTALGGTTLTAPQREIQEQELERVNAMIQQRQEQLVEIMDPSEAPEQTATRNEATELRNLIRNSRQDIASDFSQTLRLYRSAAEERQRIHQIRTNLEDSRR
jgi:hypothetical protein